MTVQAWIILDATQATDARGLNDSDHGVDPMEVANPLAANLGIPDLVGKFVLPARLLNDLGYVRWVPSLGGLPIHVLDSDTLFGPHSSGD